MSPKLPVVSGEDLIRALKKLGYQAIRQKGSHVRLYPPADSQRVPTTVPLHDEVAKGTLKGILRDANITAEQLIELL
jgi:predicted RNA binding protein YcfA (HicA-like mRNA interferase family)